MNNWQTLLQDVVQCGDKRTDRTGIGTHALFGTTICCNLSLGFPAVTTKELKFNLVCAELAAFLKSAATKKEFNDEGCKIWDKNIDTWDRCGDAGRIYGVQWREWRSVHKDGGYDETDQLQELVNSLNTNPYSRRHLVTAWNPGELDDMCLPPCHCFFQANISNDLQYLDFIVYMRSVDLVLGLPFDIASYATLQHIIAQQINKKPRDLIFFMGDSHIYKNHLGAVEIILDRKPYPPPKLVLDPAATIDNFHQGMATLSDYNHGGFVKAELNI